MDRGEGRVAAANFVRHAGVGCQHSSHIMGGEHIPTYDEGCHSRMEVDSLEYERFIG